MRGKKQTVSDGKALNYAKKSQDKCKIGVLLSAFQEYAALTHRPQANQTDAEQLVRVQQGVQNSMRGEGKQWLESNSLVEHVGFVGKR